MKNLSIAAAICLVFSTSLFAAGAAEPGRNGKIGPIVIPSTVYPAGSAPSCPGSDYRLSKDMKSCVKQCPRYLHYSAESRKCEECGAGYMTDEHGTCHVGV